MISWFREKPCALLLISVVCDSGTNKDIATIACRTCGRRWRVYYTSLRDWVGKIACMLCGSKATFREMQAYLRDRLHDKAEGTCIHCFKPADQHAEGKCLFEPTTYTPKSKVDP